MRKLLCLRETWSHHAAKSGIDPLFSALEQRAAGGVQNFFVTQETGAGDRGRFSLQGRLRRLLASSGPGTPKIDSLSPFVAARHELMGAKVIRYAKRHPKSLILLSAGENQFGRNFVAADKAIRSRTVVCLHQPPSWLRLHWRDLSALAGLGAIICLSREQREYISGACPSPTILIRFGIDHDFFRPAERRNTERSSHLLFVGNWLRDFETLVKAMRQVWNERPTVVLDCVIPHGYRSHPALLRLARDPRVRWHAGISSEALRDLYQQAALLFLPLIDAVANNSIVEALASGLPIVTTNVGGTADYIPEAAGQLCPPDDADAHARAVLGWLGDRARLDKASAAGREFAKDRLDWGRTAEKLGADLAKLLP
jgi:glycosyltransferase involved in cell wall biosynthesis